MTERAPIHPHTLESLKGSLGALKAMAGFMDIPAEGKLREDLIGTANEARANFPGLDDLTLAAFYTFMAQMEYEAARADEDANVAFRRLADASAYAHVALYLAGPITAEGTGDEAA